MKQAVLTITIVLPNGKNYSFEKTILFEHSNWEIMREDEKHRYVQALVDDKIRFSYKEEIK